MNVLFSSLSVCLNSNFYGLKHRAGVHLRVLDTQLPYLNFTLHFSFINASSYSVFITEHGRAHALYVSPFSSSSRFFPYLCLTTCFSPVLLLMVTPARQVRYASLIAVFVFLSAVQTLFHDAGVANRVIVYAGVPTCIWWAGVRRGVLRARFCKRRFISSNIIYLFLVVSFAPAALV